MSILIATALIALFIGLATSYIYFSSTSPRIETANSSPKQASANQSKPLPEQLAPSPKPAQPELPLPKELPKPAPAPQPVPAPAPKPELIPIAPPGPSQRRIDNVSNGFLEVWYPRRHVDVGLELNKEQVSKYPKLQDTIRRADLAKIDFEKKCGLRKAELSPLFDPNFSECTFSSPHASFLISIREFVELKLLLEPSLSNDELSGTGNGTFSLSYLGYVRSFKYNGTEYAAWLKVYWIPKNTTTTLAFAPEGRIRNEESPLTDGYLGGYDGFRKLMNSLRNKDDRLVNTNLTGHEFLHVWNALQHYNQSAGNPIVQLSEGKMYRHYSSTFVYNNKKYTAEFDTSWIPRLFDPKQNCEIPLPKCHPDIDELAGQYSPPSEVRAPKTSIVVQ